MKLRSFPNQVNDTKYESVPKAGPTFFSSHESSDSSKIMSESSTTPMFLDLYRILYSTCSLKDIPYLQWELESDWNYGEGYITDKESANLFESDEESYNTTSCFFNSLPNIKLPIMSIRRKVEVPCKRISKQEMRARRQELNEKAKSFLVTKIPEKSDSPFVCLECEQRFPSGQSLGGHMSKKHPGMSDRYFTKRQTRERRTKERVKLVIAKKRFYEELDYDYEEMAKTQEGREKMKKILNRGRIRAIKASINDNDIEEFAKCQNNLKKYID